VKPDAASWSTAVTDLFGAWTFAAVGPRIREDWRRDLSELLTLDTRDPRGLFEITEKSATELLVALRAPLFQAENIPDFDDHNTASQQPRLVLNPRPRHQHPRKTMSTAHPDDSITVSFATLSELASELEDILKKLNGKLDDLYDRAVPVVTSW
jgi:hypothetical protein